MYEYINERIKHLKKCEMEYFDKSVDREKYPMDMERQVYRNFSNEFNARRSELEQLVEWCECQEKDNCDHDYTHGTQSNGCDVSVCTKCGDIS